MTSVLRKLEARGLIVRTVDAADTRAKKLRVTARGAELAIQDIAVVEAADAAFFQVAADPAALLAMLRPLASDPQDSGTRLDLEAGRAS